MKKLLCMLSLVTLSACVIQPESSVVAEAEAEKIRTQKFQAELERIRDEYKLPGMTAAFVTSDGRSMTAAAGFADVEKTVLMTEESRMLAASIGKTFVAAVSISLALEGRLSLDEPIGRWLGKYEWFERLPNHQVITMRHLLTHSSGLPDHVHLESFQKAFASEWQSLSNVFPPERLVGFILDTPALFAAGEGWSYSDTGYILAGMVIEAVTGNNYYDEVAVRFLKPLKLTDTLPSDQRRLAKLAAGYMSPENPFGLPPKSLDDNGLLHFHPGIEWTGGGMVSSSRDLARWGAALFSGTVNEGDYLPELYNAVAIDSTMPDIQYGAGVTIYKTSPVGPVYGHAGWIPGYVSSLRHYKDSDVTIAFQINTDAGAISSDENIPRKIEQRLLQFVMQNKD